MLGPLATLDQEESILVVDDTASNRTLYATLLSHAGYRVRTAKSGSDALCLIAEEAPSLMLLDYMMPEMNGAQVIERLNAEAAPISFPIVVLTASLNTDDIEAALVAGAADYINKPVDSRILLTRVKSIITAHHNRLKARAEPERDALRLELDEAQAVQRAQLPLVPVLWSAWTATGAVVPSGRIAGDVFDLIVLHDDRAIALLIDVSGHGTASALVAAETRTRFRELVAERTLLEALRLLNQRMTERDTGKYSCLAALEVRGRDVTVVNAGLPPVVLWRSGSAISSVRASGFPIGMFADSEYQSTSFQVEPGDSLVMMSDGLTEPFGATDDVPAALARLGLTAGTEAVNLTSEGLRSRLGSLKSQRDAGGGELPDDATLVLLRWRGLEITRSQKAIPAAPSEIRECVDWVLGVAPAGTPQDSVRIGLTEALTNAIVHGALQISSEGREVDYESYLAAIDTATQRPSETLPKVQVTLTTTETEFTVRVDWPGLACPPEQRAPTAREATSSGFGTALIHATFDRVDWDESGRGLSLTCHRRR